MLHLYLKYQFERNYCKVIPIGSWVIDKGFGFAKRRSNSKDVHVTDWINSVRNRRATDSGRPTGWPGWSVVSHDLGSISVRRERRRRREDDQYRNR